jgi:hypothetical protein
VAENGDVSCNIDDLELGIPILTLLYLGMADAEQGNYKNDMKGFDERNLTRMDEFETPASAFANKAHLAESASHITAQIYHKGSNEIAEN